MSMKLIYIHKLNKYTVLNLYYVIYTFKSSIMHDTLKKLCKRCFLFSYCIKGYSRLRILEISVECVKDVFFSWNDSRGMKYT